MNREAMTQRPLPRAMSIEQARTHFEDIASRVTDNPNQNGYSLLYYSDADSLYQIMLTIRDLIESGDADVLPEDLQTTSGLQTFIGDPEEFNDHPVFNTLQIDQTTGAIAQFIGRLAIGIVIFTTISRTAGARIVATLNLSRFLTATNTIWAREYIASHLATPVFYGLDLALGFHPEGEEAEYTLGYHMSHTHGAFMGLLALNGVLRGWAGIRLRVPQLPYALRNGRWPDPLPANAFYNLRAEGRIVWEFTDLRTTGNPSWQTTVGTPETIFRIDGASPYPYTSVQPIPPGIRPEVYRAFDTIPPLFRAQRPQQALGNLGDDFWQGIRINEELGLPTVE
jgi:hypothetical protein